MSINKVNCLKIETAGFLLGWSYLTAFLIGFLAILTASLIGIYLYIAAGDGVLAALLIFFIMIFSLIVTGILAYISKDFIEGVRNQKIPQIRRFKLLIGFFCLLSFISLIIALIGSTHTFPFQKSWSNSSSPPLGLEFVGIALLLLSLHVGFFLIVDMIHKKFNHLEMRREIFKENSNVNIVSFHPQQRARREIHMKIPEIDLPPPPKF